MADPDGPCHCVGVTVEKAASCIGVTGVYLIVAAKDINHHEFSILSGFDFGADSLFVEGGASGREVSGH